MRRSPVRDGTEGGAARRKQQGPSSGPRRATAPPPSLLSTAASSCARTLLLVCILDLEFPFCHLWALVNARPSLPPAPVRQVRGPGTRPVSSGPGAGCWRRSRVVSPEMGPAQSPSPTDPLTRGTETASARAAAPGLREAVRRAGAALRGEGLVRSPPSSACWPTLGGPATAGLVFWPEVVTGENAAVLGAPPGGERPGDVWLCWG